MCAKLGPSVAVASILFRCTATTSSPSMVKRTWTCCTTSPPSYVASLARGSLQAISTARPPPSTEIDTLVTAVQPSPRAAHEKDVAPQPPPRECDADAVRPPPPSPREREARDGKVSAAHPPNQPSSPPVLPPSPLPLSPAEDEDARAAIRLGLGGGQGHGGLQNEPGASLAVKAAGGVDDGDGGSLTKPAADANATTTESASFSMVVRTDGNATLPVARSPLRLHPTFVGHVTPPADGPPSVAEWAAEASAARGFDKPAAGPQRRVCSVARDAQGHRTPLIWAFSKAPRAFFVVAFYSVRFVLRRTPRASRSMVNSQLLILLSPMPPPPRRLPSRTPRARVVVSARPRPTPALCPTTLRHANATLFTRA